MKKPDTTKLNLPGIDKGIRGFNENIAVNAFTGAFSLPLPISIPTGRELTPSLSLNYDSGNGNGLFGCGFDITEQSISKLTRRGIPRYDNNDIYTLNGTELVQKEANDHSYLERHQHYYPHIVQHNSGTEESYWQTIDKENVNSIYGNTDESRIYDPVNKSKIFKWLLSEVYDSKGNKVKYNYNKYKGTNSYLSSIQYGNYIKDNNETFAFEIVFDYGNYDLRSLDRANAAPYTPVGNPPVRMDVLHSFRSAFHVKTEYLCRNILIFHKFSALDVQPYLTKYFSLKYDENKLVSTLLSFQETGCVLQTNKSYLTQSIPAIEFKFSKFDSTENPIYKELEADNSKLQILTDFADFEGEGINGLLYKQGNTLLYYTPLGEGKFHQNKPPLELPNGYTESQAHLYLKSVNGDGTLQLVAETENESGYYTLDSYNKWNNYTPFAFNFKNTVFEYLEEVDLSGNGLSDKIILEPDQIQYIPSLGYKGYGQSVIIKEDTKENVVYPGSLTNINAHIIHAFADMFGDGLSHRVEIRSSEVRVWPTLGYGYFDLPISITGAPELADNFDLRSRLLLTDVDGSGTTDIVLLFENYIEIYINQSGNSFSGPIRINLPKEVEYSNLDSIQFADVVGNGNTCLLFTKTGLPVKYYYVELGDTNLCQGQVCKPYLLHQIDNNVGAKSYVEYVSSVKYYLDDKQKGHAWFSKLPFPIQVVEQTITEDCLNHNTLTTAYSYQNGYYDPFERVFVGFGYVEHRDISKNISEINEDPPATITKQWFHLGNGMNDKMVRASFFNEDERAPELPFALFDFDFDKATDHTRQQALYILAGSEIRTEIFAEGVEIPYSVSGSCFYVKNVQKASESVFGVFSAFSNESVTLDYEQDTHDPAMEQHAVLQTDEYNNPLLTINVHYPRRVPLLPEQARFYAVASKAVLINQDIIMLRWIGVPLETLTFEITGLKISDDKKYVDYSILKASIPDVVSHNIPYSDKAPEDILCARTLSWEKDFYWDVDQANYIENPVAGSFPAVVLPHHTENIEFDNILIKEVYNKDKDRLHEDVIIKQGFVYKNDYWWNRSLINHYEKGNFYLLRSVANDWVHSDQLEPSLYIENNVEYDNYYLFPIQTSQKLSDTVSLKVNAKIDYRLLTPWCITDINNNSSEVLFDELGRVVVATYYGKVNGNDEGFLPISSYDYKKPPDVEDILNDATVLEYLQKAESFAYYKFAEKNQDGSLIPSTVVTLKATEYQTTDIQKIEKTVSYSDGFGRIIEAKQWAGKVALIDGTETANGWLTSGRVTYNGKGLVDKSYLSFFSKDHQYESQWDKQVKPLLPKPTSFTYDALDRVVRTDTPKGFFSKTVYGVWEEKMFDEDDTVIDSGYYQEFMKTHTNGDEYDALMQAAEFYNTPNRVLFDALGRTVIALQDNLGRVYPSSFDPIATAEITSQAIYDSLEKNGYLSPAQDRNGAWVTDKFTPYIKGFILHLDEPVLRLATEIQNILAQSRLATWQEYDITGSEIRNADPRFFSLNLNSEKPIYNFTHFYGITGGSPLLTQSIDAGENRAFQNMLSQPVISWNALDICSSLTYDNLQRPLTLHISTPPEYIPAINHIVHRIEYGELNGGADMQLMGEVFKIYDSAGVVTTPEYNIIGTPGNETRQFRIDYKNEANWDTVTHEQLEDVYYTTFLQYDALGRLLTEKQPDNTLLNWQYGPLGNCIRSTVNPEGKGQTEIISDSELDANGQPIKVRYGNGVHTKHIYDKDTLELLQIGSTRDLGKDQFQQLIYTHDPTGLVTTIENTTQKTIFHNNQEINPKTQYYYDAIYRVKKAEGRLLKGLHTKAKKANKSSSLTYHSNASASNLREVENYTETYQYDNGDNLIQLRRTGTSAFTRRFEIAEISNRLIKSNDASIVYDVAGQMQNLPEGATLRWNYTGNLQSAIIIERADGNHDAEYYVYDYTGMRVRKVNEKLADGNKYISDKRYVGNYTITRSGTGANVQDMTVSKDLRTISVGGFSKHDCLVQYWAINPDKPVYEPFYRFQHSDIINSVTIETNLQAAIISLEEYSPFGETTYTWSDTNLEISPKEYRYSAQEKDTATGLYYYGYRYYLPTICRWTHPDPDGTIDGLNIYAFVENDPVNEGDSSGLSRNKTTRTKTTQRKTAKKNSGTSKVQTFKPSDDSDHEHEEEATDNIRKTITGVASRGKKRPQLTPKKHKILMKESFHEGYRMGKEHGYIVLFRVTDKKNIKTVASNGGKRELPVTPGPPWTHRRSISFVQGAISARAVIVLATPLNNQTIVQSSGPHKGEIAILGREANMALASGYQLKKRNVEKYLKSKGKIMGNVLIPPTIRRRRSVRYRSAMVYGDSLADHKPLNKIINAKRQRRKKARSA